MADRVLVTLDGEVRDADAPLLHADDFGVLRGDGVFETLLVRGGRARAVELHLARLASSASVADLPAPELDDWRMAIDIAVEEWGDAREGVLRLVYTRGREFGDGPTAFLLVTPVAERVEAARRDGVSVVSLERGYSVDLAQKAPWQLLGAKTLSYATNMAALRHAESVGADDVIYTSSEGHVLEGPRSTVVIARGRTLLTIPPEQGILPGTTQQALFEAARGHDLTVRYEALRPADLIVADGVWLLSSVALAVRVHTLDGHSLATEALEGEIEKLVDKAIETTR
ncbi:aminodeoxychorismate lyase [Rhodococcus sp. F64268]|uniref:aminodeoxychorismate lyase n=1 Tax=Rhodococcus sp. F64268 TaxID=2926402 RepID=UPI001FF12596|nr:aminodeoxychorismate lyase [Rhodococcus sp. F64268]MCK0089346.1 aminodeoxychorismate lyase [Rhodococcus sp. F64268]